jgi:predicted nucleotidyltransferase
MSLTTFTSHQIQALRVLSDLWGPNDVVLIGASALGCYIDMRWRKTNDLDLLLSVSIDEYTAGLGEIPGWTRHPKQEHEWSSPQGIRVDIIPGGPGLLEAGELVWPESGFRMSLVGFRLVFEHAKPFRVDDTLTIRVAPMPVLAVLKMVSFADRPSERERDLEDLAYLLEGYLEEDEKRRYSPEIIERGLSFEETNAFLLGVDIAALVNSSERKVVTSFFARLQTEDDATAARMLRLGPDLWKMNPQMLIRQAKAFEQGFRENSEQNRRA